MIILCIHSRKGLSTEEIQRNHNPLHDIPSCLFSSPSRFAEAYLIEVAQFCDVIAGKAQVEVTLQDSLNSTRIAEICGLSAAKGIPVPF